LPFSHHPFNYYSRHPLLLHCCSLRFIKNHLHHPSAKTISRQLLLLVIIIFSCRLPTNDLLFLETVMTGAWTLRLPLDWLKDRAVNGSVKKRITNFLQNWLDD